MPAACLRSALLFLIGYTSFIFGVASPVLASDLNNSLTDAEQKAGWKLLFDGESLRGWRNYRQDDVSDGWSIVEGALTRIGDGAGDIMTIDQYEGFELSIDYKISPGGNSGIMFHVTEDARSAPWSGPEVQVQDNQDGHDIQKSGWLYQLYRSSVDATKPAGHWNTIHLRVAPDESVLHMNGVRYYRFQKGSRDWQQRVAQSKFADTDGWGESTKGHIVLQDHGDRVAYRNIKIRELQKDAKTYDPVDSELALESVLAFPQLKWAGWQPVDKAGRPQSLRPIVLTHAGDGTDRIFVATQRGVLHVFPNDPQVQKSNVFLDISSRVVYSDQQNEEGLLGVAFHPNYKENGEFFIYYTTQDQPQTSLISRFRVSADDPDRALKDSEEEIIRLKQPYWNHNGGTLAFGPDGMLYVALGDGGAANDPHDNGQDLSTLLGSILRIDVDGTAGDQKYTIPKDNPFVALSHARGEIWAYGVRNIWRLAFDPETKLLWAADVGQNLWEEINIIQRGGNYGWNLREASHEFGPHGVGPRADLIDPIWEYDHGVGKSITGGFVYRGTRLPELAGHYVYGDYISGKLWALNYDHQSGKVLGNYRIPSQPTNQVISFGEDENGEIYFMLVTPTGRGIYRFERSE